MTKEEELICNKVIELLSDERDKSKFGIEERTDNYTTLMYCDNDFFRVKFTNNVSWISIRLAKQDKNENDERFNAQKNKKQSHWKANIYSINDINNFKNELLNACINFGTSDTYKPSEYIGSTITFGYKR